MRGHEDLSRRRRVLIMGAAIIAVLGLAAAAGWQVGHEVTDRMNVDCHTTVEPSDGPDFAGTGLAFADSGDGQPPIDDPVAACAELYRQGVIELGSQHAVVPSPGDHEVPALVGCVSPAGVAAVYPSARDDVCAQLGLPPLEP